MKIRTATINDLDRITQLEAICFPEAEAATREAFEQRLTYYPDHFWLLEDKETLISFVNGMVTEEEHLTDKMYEDASMHKEDGKWQMIFGVNTAPEYRQKGYAAEILNQVISDARAQQRSGLVLTCKDRLVSYYAKFGFVDEGRSGSEHGGVSWHEMRLTF
ncbi:MAG: GNAT family N-acetyltransferase [bacterium]|nr:GNAT family N-acetyltransferase [bacterium]